MVIYYVWLFVCPEPEVCQVANGVDDQVMRQASKKTYKINRKGIVDKVQTFNIVYGVEATINTNVY